MIDSLAAQEAKFAMKEYREDGKEPIYSGFSERYMATLTFTGPADDPTKASFVIPISGSNIMLDGPKLALAGTFLRQFNGAAGEWMTQTLTAHPVTARSVQSITLGEDDIQLRSTPMNNGSVLVSLSVTPTAGSR